MLKPPKSKDDLRRWTDEATRLINSGAQIKGVNGIKISKGIGGVVITNTRTGTGNKVLRARVKANAGTGTTITCQFYKADGSNPDAGDDDITVYCSICGGTNLNAAAPRLEAGDDIFITKGRRLNGSTLESCWYCVTVFQGTQDCES